MRDSHPRVQRMNHCGDTDPYIADPLHARNSNDAGGGWSGSFKQFMPRTISRVPSDIKNLTAIRFEVRCKCKPYNPIRMRRHLPFQGVAQQRDRLRTR